MDRKGNPKPKERRHDPTPEERDERVKAPEGMTFKEAVERVLLPVDEGDEDQE